MHQRTAIALTSIALAVGVVSYDAATYASTGDSLILGKVNKANKSTVLQRTTKGPALELKTKSGPPLKVSSSTKVTKLNADTVDGLDAADLGVSAIRVPIPQTAAASTQDFTLPALPPGDYLASYGVLANGNVPVECLLQRTSAPSAVISRASAPAGSDGDLGINGSGVMSVQSGDTWIFRCASITAGDFNWRNSATEKSAIVLVPLTNGITVLD